MKDFRRLLDVLNEETKQQDELLKLLVLERGAIVKLKHDEATKLAEQKELLLTKAQATEKKRQQVVAELADGEDVKLTKLISSCSTLTVKKELAAKQKELKTTVSRVRELSIGNNELLSQALGVISSTLAIIKSAATGDTTPTYGKKGVIKDDLGDSALIRRRSVTTSA